MVLSFIAVLTLLFTATAAPVGGGENGPVVELTPAGRINKQPVYQLRLNYEQPGRFYIVVKDDHNEVLHEEFVTGKNITRLFQINTLELGNTSLVFEVYNAYGMLTGAFRVNPNRGAETAVLYSAVR